MRAIIVRGGSDLDVPEVRRIIERGLLWASRVGPAG
jgi:hypothetical protein